MIKPIVTAAVEGGLYSPDRDVNAVIRIYADRRVQDDIVTAHTGAKWRERLSRKAFRLARRAALRNRRLGLV